MNKYYAQTDELGNVHTICQLASSEMSNEKIIKIDKMDNELINSKYDKASKKFKKEINNKMHEYDVNDKKFKEVK